jgi:hypothetical protein
LAELQNAVNKILNKNIRLNWYLYIICGYFRYKITQINNI